MNKTPENSGALGLNERMLTILKDFVAVDPALHNHVDEYAAHCPYCHCSGREDHKDTCPYTQTIALLDELTIKSPRVTEAIATYDEWRPAHDAERNAHYKLDGLVRGMTPDEERVYRAAIHGKK